MVAAKTLHKMWCFSVTNGNVLAPEKKWDLHIGKAIPFSKSSLWKSCEMMIDIYGDLCALKFDNKPFELQSFSHEFFLFWFSITKLFYFLI